MALTTANDPAARRRAIQIVLNSVFSASRPGFERAGRRESQARDFTRAVP
jgi:hypothetical protein